jgi:hypothetical protein
MENVNTDDLQASLENMLMWLRNGAVVVGNDFFFESRILTCLTYTSRRGSQHRGQTAEQEDTKARKAKLQRPRTAAQGSLSHKQQAYITS